MPIHFNKVVWKYWLMSGDEELCTSSILLIHSEDTEWDIMKRIFWMLISGLELPANLIKAYDLRQWLSSGKFDEDDLETAYEILFERSSFGRENYYTI